MSSPTTLMPSTCPVHSRKSPPSPFCSGLARGLFTGTLNPPPCRSSTGFTLRNSRELQAASRQARPGRFVRSRRCDRRLEAHGYGGFLLSAVRPRLAGPEIEEKGNIMNTTHEILKRLYHDVYRGRQCWEYTETLEAAQVAAGMNAALRNARRLADDATLLLEIHWPSSSNSFMRADAAQSESRSDPRRFCPAH